VLRVLSMWQPWASLCVVPDPAYGGARPAKSYETRHWRPTYPPPIHVAIHATKKYLPPERGSRMHDALLRCEIDPVPRGVIIGLATISELIPTEQLLTKWRDGTGEIMPEFADEVDFGDYRYGRYAYRLDDVVALPEPIPFKGRQEPLYELPEPALAAVLSSMAGAAR
jgi:hypothetical protein